MDLVLVIMAGFGALCVVWTLFGLLLTGRRGTVMVCLCPEDAETVVRHHGWLRDLGLLRCPLILVDAEQGNWDERLGVECCTMDQILQRLEQERARFE